MVNGQQAGDLQTEQSVENSGVQLLREMRRSLRCITGDWRWLAMRRRGRSRGRLASGVVRDRSLLLLFNPLPWTLPLQATTISFAMAPKASKSVKSAPIQPVPEKRGYEFGGPYVCSNPT